jgi:hypothetical protein
MPSSKDGSKVVGKPMVISFKKDLYNYPDYNIDNINYWYIRDLDYADDQFQISWYDGSIVPYSYMNTSANIPRGLTGSNGYITLTYIDNYLLNRNIPNHTKGLPAVVTYIYKSSYNPKPLFIFNTSKFEYRLLPLRIWICFLHVLQIS